MKVLTVFFFSLIQFQAHAEIKEITSMKSIETYVQPGTLLVFDLDNTVIEPLQTLGSDQWFEYMLKTKTLDETIKVWESVQRKTVVRAVESTTPELIRSYQSKGYQVIALTARTANMLDTSVKQLNSIGVKFSLILTLKAQETKGDVLLRYLNQNTKKFQRVVFIDDRKIHVNSVEKELKKTSLQHYEFRYGAADSKVHALSTQVADCEMKIFQEQGRLVDDQQCAKGSN